MRTLAEATQFQSITESALGVPLTSAYLRHRPNAIGKFGAAFKTESSNPIGAGRQQHKGEVVDLDCPVEWSADLSKDLIESFVEGMMMAATKHCGGTGTSFFQPTAKTSSALTVAAGGALPAGTLMWLRGWRNGAAADNGLKAVDVSSGATSIPIVGGLTAETPGALYLAYAEVAGFRFTSGDAQLDASNNLICTTADFTTMGLYVGQWIWLGGTVGTALAFGSTAIRRGWAQINAISATKLTLARRTWAVTGADTGTAKTIDIYFGRWVRNTNAQSTDYLEKSYTFETTYATLGGPTTPEYEYTQGVYLSQFVFNMNPGTRATCDLSFVGATTIDPSTTRLTGASLALAPIQGAIYNTSTSMLRVRISNADESGLSTDIKTLKITISNGVTRELVLGTLGARFMNVGDFTATIDTEMLFTSDTVIAAVRDKRTCMFEVGQRNGDGGFLLDIPSMTLDAADRTFTKNMSVTIKGKTSGFEDPFYGFTAGITIFPYLPAA